MEERSAPGASTGSALARITSSIGENVLSAMRALTQNWLRTLLTMLGIVIGVVSVVSLVAILQGVKNEVSHQLEGLGANLVLVVPGRLDDSGQPNPMAMMGISTLRQADVTALKQVPGVKQVSPVMFISGAASRAGKGTVTALVVATNRDGVDMNPTRLAEGRYFNDTERGQRLCVLAQKPRVALFDSGRALGERVKIGGRDWTVVGDLRRPDDDGTLGSHVLGLSNLIYIPYDTAIALLPGGQVNRIVLKTDYLHPADKLVSNLRAALLKSHGGQEDFGLITQTKGLALVIKLLNMAQSLLALIAAISLFVAGVGIMNIMLVTVTERTREVGIRKTVGARRTDVFLQFLTEAMVLSIIGGAGGIALSFLFCAAVARYSPLSPDITPGAVAMALAVCIAVGVLFGVAPAIRASRLDPIAALRHE